MEKRDPRTVVAIILGGGAGTRLFPLTKRRAKPAVSVLVELEFMVSCYNIVDKKEMVVNKILGANWRCIQAYRCANEQLYQQWNQQNLHSHSI